MSDLPKRRLIDQLGSSPTFVAEGCHLTGDVETGGPLVVCGAIRGDGRVGGALSMAAKSQWEGEIHALAAVIAGRISGKPATIALFVITHKARGFGPASGAGPNTMLSIIGRIPRRSRAAFAPFLP